MRAQSRAGKDAGPSRSTAAVDPGGPRRSAPRSGMSRANLVREATKGTSVPGTGEMSTGSAGGGQAAIPGRKRSREWEG